MNVDTLFGVSIAKLILISQTISFEVIQNGSRSDRAPRLNKYLSLNFGWLKSAIQRKFIEEFGICFEKHILVKNVYKWTKNGFAIMRSKGKDK